MIRTTQWLLLPLLTAALTSHAQDAAPTAKGLEGQWLFIASNNGVEVAPGIYSPRTDTVRFTAVADGDALLCHADSFLTRNHMAYPADWSMVVERDTDGRHRIGWVLSSEQPFSGTEFNEPSENYLENGFYYWGNGTEPHHYIYLLAENADASALIGMTFRSDWSGLTADVYSLSNADYQSRKLYAVVASAIPYGGSVGWIEIWSSPQLKRIADTAEGISETAADGTPGSDNFYDLQGRRISGQPLHGLYIRNHRKYWLR